MIDLTNALWRKSSLSGNGGADCVEVATNLPGIATVRDSKDPLGPVLVSPLAGGGPLSMVSKGASSTAWGELGVYLGRSPRSMVMGKGTGTVRWPWWMPVRLYARVAGSSS